MPAYYAVIPASVRYDKNLSANAKLLYGEITALCNEKGYCWASNSYFAELYSVSERSISTWVNLLVSNGYLTSSIKYKKGSREVESRILSVASIPIEENFLTPRRKLPDPHEENFQENTTVNNTNNNKESEQYENNQPFRSEQFSKAWEEWLQYRKERKIAKYTGKGLKHVFKHLQSISFNNEATAIKILEQSMGNGWQGLFPLKNTGNTYNHTVTNKLTYQQELDQKRSAYIPISE